MKHYIIVKFNSQGASWRDWLGDIQEIFDRTLAIDGVHSVRLIPGITERANHFDLMICMDMDASALPVYDASEAHKEWKERYGRFIEKKTIFDC